MTCEGPPLEPSGRACEPSVAAEEPVAMFREGRYGVEMPQPEASGRYLNYQAENELPQPQPPVEFGFLKVKPDPCIDET